MEAKVKAIKSGSIIVILSLIIFSVVGFSMEDGNLKDILFAIFSGIFTSAFVTIFIYATEYRVVKKETMEEYFNASYKANQMIIQVPYLVFDEPIELVSEYFAEISENKSRQDLLNQLPKDYVKSAWEDELKISTTAEDKMVEYLRPSYNLLNADKEEIDKIIRASLKERMCKYEKMINAVMEQYIKIADFSYEASENAYGKMYFFTGQRFRESTYKKIHDPLRKTLQTIRVRAYGDFKSHLDESAYDLPVMIEYINQLQKEIFEIEYVCVDEEKGYSVVKSIKNKYYFEMDKKIEDFRAERYHCTPEYQKEFYSYNRLI